MYSDSYCLSKPKTHSRVSGNYFLSSISADPSKQPKNLINNFPLHTKFRFLSHVVALATEDELGVLFPNEKTTIPLHTTL